MSDALLRYETLFEIMCDAFENSGIIVSRMSPGKAAKGKDRSIRVRKNKDDVDLCGIYVATDSYKIWTPITGYQKETKYAGYLKTDGTFNYYVGSLEECIGEVERLARFEG